jgi:hypothetical protein
MKKFRAPLDRWRELRAPLEPKAKPCLDARKLGLGAGEEEERKRKWGGASRPDSWVGSGPR